MSRARATFGRLTRLPSGKMVGMRSTDRIRIVAWVCLLGGFLIIAWQAASGSGSDKLFNIGLVAMITGSVLRLYGKYSHSNRWADVPREPPESRRVVLLLLAMLPRAAALVKLRYFAGLTMPEVAAAMGVPLRTAERNWTFARTWLERELSREVGRIGSEPSA
jgi:ECF sigma factor